MAPFIRVQPKLLQMRCVLRRNISSTNAQMPVGDRLHKFKGLRITPMQLAFNEGELFKGHLGSS